MRHATTTRLALLGLLVAALSACGSADHDPLNHPAAATAKTTDVTGAGSSFVYPLMSRWTATWAAQTGHHVNYQSIGSSGGIAQAKAGTVDFGASDKPLSPAALDKAGLVQFPLVIGGIVPVVNIHGIEAGELLLDGPLLASIFLGNIDHWNDPAIARLNPGVALPDVRIQVVHRSDGSGTTFNFSNYLAKVSPVWKAEVGEGAAIRWPTGIGGKGNQGVTAYVRQLDGAIGYVEYAYALENEVAWARMRNRAGKVVVPGTASFQAAAATADWASAEDFSLIMTHAKGANAWPLTATTWVIMHQRPRHPQRARAALAFFRWAFEHGQPQAEALHYVPLPAALVQRIHAYWDSQWSAMP